MFNARSIMKSSMCMCCDRCLSGTSARCRR